MKFFLVAGLCCVFISGLFGQVKDTAGHNSFMLYLKKTKADSVYNVYLQADEKSDAYKYNQILRYRNKYGWLLGKVEQLKKDIPSILVRPYADQMDYNVIFNPEDYPASEWPWFYETAIVLEKYFDEKSNAYREILGVKTKLQTLLKDDEALLKDLPKLLKLLDTESIHFSEKLLEYGNLLIKNNEREKGIGVFEKGLTLDREYLFLESLVILYSDNQEYKKVLEYEAQILNDHSIGLYFYLAEAYLILGDRDMASRYFGLYTAAFKFIENSAYVYVEYGDNLFVVTAQKMKDLGNFYCVEDNGRACNYYNYGLKIINDSDKRKKRLKRQQLVAYSEKEREQLLVAYQEYEKELSQLLVEIQKQMDNCGCLVKE